VARVATVIDTALARRIAFVALDVDGTLTDNGVYIGASTSNAVALHEHVELKRFDVQDGLGIVMLRRAGIRLAFVSARESVSTTMRGRELGIEFVRQGRGLKKVPVLREISASTGIPFEAMAFMGDDLADIAPMQHVALAVAPQNAVADVKAVAHVTLSCAGGRGAVREFAELLLRARGEWDALVAAYVAESAGANPALA
jgi:3-deoxy-D-manno-octulosonate 8-phosphate phosphatase (KDO 8-P phosphatase)